MVKIHVNGQITFVTKEKKKKLDKDAQKIIRDELRIDSIEAREQAEKMIDIFRITHPQNTGSGFKNGIEVKFLLRGDGQSVSLGNVVLYRLDDRKEVEKLAEKLEEVSEFSHCTYFSLFTFDSTKEVNTGTKQINAEGKRVIVKKPVHKIQRGNAVETAVLPFDMDNVSSEEFNEFKEFLAGLGIEILSMFSGNGYQGYILLDKPTKNKKVFEKFTNLLRKLGWKVDPTISDPERVMRAFYTYNAKQYSSLFKYYKPNGAEPVGTKIVSFTNKRYELQEVFELLEGCLDKKSDKVTQKTVSEVKKEELKSILDVIEAENKPVMVKKTGVAALYRYINYNSQPSHVQNMLQGAGEGMRNASVMYLTNYLNNSLGLSPEHALDTLKTFNCLCKPPMPESKLVSDYYRITDNYGHYKQGLYTKEMAREFGLIDKDTVIRLSADKLKVERNVILKIKEIGATAFSMYLTVLYLEVHEDKKHFTQKEIADFMDVSNKTVKRAFDELSKISKMLEIKEGRTVLYGINPWARENGGFVLFSKLLVKDMVKELKVEQTALYSIMLFLFKMYDSTLLLTSQEHLAEMMNLTQSRISQLTDELHDAKYLNKNTIITKTNKKKSDYLLRNE